MKTDKNKELLLEQLRKTPIVQVSCGKLNISRATYYRWRSKSKEFSSKADEAITEGALFVNDIAESQLMSAIKDKNLTAIIFWLKHHHPAYADRIEVRGKLKHQYSLTSEQEALIAKALSMVIGKDKNGK